MLEKIPYLTSYSSLMSLRNSQNDIFFTLQKGLSWTPRMTTGMAVPFSKCKSKYNEVIPIVPLEVNRFWIYARQNWKN